MRYDPTKEIYRDCRWCGGRGCLSCPSEAKRNYERTSPGGPKPIAQFKLSDLDTPDRGDAIRGALGPDAVMKAFGKDGGGIEEIIENCVKAGISK